MACQLPHALPEGGKSRMATMPPRPPGDREGRRLVVRARCPYCGEEIVVGPAPEKASNEPAATMRPCPHYVFDDPTNHPARDLRPPRVRHRTRCEAGGVQPGGGPRPNPERPFQVRRAGRVRAVRGRRSGPRGERSRTSCGLEGSTCRRRVRGRARPVGAELR